MVTIEPLQANVEQVYKHTNTQKECTMTMTRWNVAVSSNTDQSLRMFLASQGGGRKAAILNVP